MKKIYFAPLEGITGVLFRNAYHRHYKGVDRFYSPFISPYGTCVMTPKERADVDPDSNGVNELVPQILANNPEYFAGSAAVLADMGYRRVNINIGCPSGTVCSKKKGAGLLGYPELLDGFLKGIFENSEISRLKISIKARLGVEDEAEFPGILEIYNRYPISELIIHPRLRRDMYKGKPRLDLFRYACENTDLPLIYNGDINSSEDIENIPGIDKISGVMIGRGLLKKPFLAEEIKRRYPDFASNSAADIAPDSDFKSAFDSTRDSARDIAHNSAFDRDLDSAGHSIHGSIPELLRFKALHDDIYHGYQEIISPDLHTLFRMKELWTYWIDMFPGREREYKAILKAKYYSQYDIAVKSLIEEHL